MPIQFELVDDVVPIMLALFGKEDVVVRVYGPVPVPEEHSPEVLLTISLKQPGYDIVDEPEIGDQLKKAEGNKIILAFTEIEVMERFVDNLSKFVREVKAQTLRFTKDKE